MLDQEWKSIIKLTENSTFWYVLYLTFSLGCIFFYLTFDNTVKGVLNILEYCHRNQIAWSVCGFAFGIHMIKKIFFKELSIKRSFIHFLNPFLEAATYAIVLKSSLTFLYAVLKQNIILNIDQDNTPTPFNESYFGGFDYLTLSVAAFFLIIFSINKLQEEIVGSLTIAKTNKIQVATQEEYERSKQISSSSSQNHSKIDIDS